MPGAAGGWAVGWPAGCGGDWVRIASAVWGAGPAPTGAGSLRGPAGVFGSGVGGAAAVGGNAGTVRVIDGAGVLGGAGGL